MKTNKNYGVVLLLSGGMDSAVLLQLALSSEMNPYCILVDYGQKHVTEITLAAKMCIDNDVSYHKVKVEMPNVSSKLLNAQEGGYKGVSEWHVPSRNLMFISFAASFAESNNIPLIWYGANYEDREHLFPDCYQEWVFKLNELLAINGSMVIKVEAPLLGMEKETIRNLAKQFDINNDEILSGYETKEK